MYVSGNLFFLTRHGSGNAGFISHMTTEATPQTADTPTETPQSTPDRTFTQAELDAIVKDRLERQKRASEAATEKAKKDAEAAVLAQQGEFKALAEQRQAELDVIKPKADQVESLEAALHALLETQKAGLPKPILALLNKLPATEQASYLKDNAAELRKPVAPEINSGNKGDAQTKADAAKTQVEALRKSGHYSSF